MWNAGDRQVPGTRQLRDCRHEVSYGQRQPNADAVRTTMIMRLQFSKEATKANDRCIVQIPDQQNLQQPNVVPIQSPTYAIKHSTVTA
jgi:hypothetical protein